VGKRVLLVGESWVSEATHYKGFDSFTSVTFHSGADWYNAALRSKGHTVEQMYAHDVPARFPHNREELAAYDVIVLSDIGTNSFLLPIETWMQGKSTPNRLKLLADWVRDGGALIMAGGYLSFQGFEAKARFAGSHVEEVLPVTCLTHDDRVEVPEGAQPTVVDAAHPVLAGISGSMPTLLGYNRVVLKPGSTLVASVGNDPLIATAQVGKGRSLVWTSDIGPHWCPEPFVQWAGFAPLMANMVDWVSSK
jgi:uncharacterized membrane protein